MQGAEGVTRVHDARLDDVGRGADGGGDGTGHGRGDKVEGETVLHAVAGEQGLEGVVRDELGRVHEDTTDLGPLAKWWWWH